MRNNDLSGYSLSGYRLFAHPYVPLPSGGRGASRRYAYKYNIAYTETFRGIADEIPALLFYAPIGLIQDVCKGLFRLMDGKVKNMLVSEERSCCARNGKCNLRVEVQVVGLNEDLISLQQFAFLVASMLKRKCRCSVRRYKLETFLNL